MFPHESGYAGSWRGRYPGLIPGEQTLITRWLDNLGRDVEQIWYNIRMDGAPGRTAAEDATTDESAASMARLYYTLTARRADAIALRASRYQIIEARAAADAQTIGEVVMYNLLARTEWPELMWGNAIVITSRCAPTVRSVFAAQNISLIIDEDAAVDPTVPIAEITR